MLTIQKLYFLMGLLTIGAAMFVPRLTEELALAGLFSMVLGAMQVYTRVPMKLRAIVLVAYAAGVVAFVIGGKIAESTGAVLLSFILIGHIAGLLRFSPHQSTN